MSIWSRSTNPPEDDVSEPRERGLRHARAQLARRRRQFGILSGGAPLQSWSANNERDMFTLGDACDQLLFRWMPRMMNLARLPEKCDVLEPLLSHATAGMITLTRRREKCDALMLLISRVTAGMFDFAQQPEKCDALKPLLLRERKF